MYHWKPGLQCSHGYYWKCRVCGVRAPVVGNVIDSEFPEVGEPETLPEFKAAEPSDTTPAPPPVHPMPKAPVTTPGKCYWCGDSAYVAVYHGIPSCDSCKRRAVGRARTSQ